MAPHSEKSSRLDNVTEEPPTNLTMLQNTKQDFAVLAHIQEGNQISVQGTPTIADLTRWDRTAPIGSAQPNLASTAHGSHCGERKLGKIIDSRTK